MTNGLFDNLEAKGSIPRLNQCYLCKSWHLEEEPSVYRGPGSGRVCSEIDLQ